MYTDSQTIDVYACKEAAMPKRKKSMMLNKTVIANILLLILNDFMYHFY